MFAGWDIFEDNCYEAAVHAGVLEPSLLEKIKDELSAIKPMTAVFDRQYVKRLDGPNVKKGTNKKDLAEQVRADIRKFKADHDLDRVVFIWCGSTEVYMTESAGPRDAGGVRAGAGQQRPGHPVLDDLRLRRHHGGRSLRQRRAEPVGRHPGADHARPAATACR